jgi:hypothetical protein
MKDKIHYRGGPLDGQSRPMTAARYVLVPDQDGSIVCATEYGPRTCFTHHRYELVSQRLTLAPPYRDEPEMTVTYLKYLGREPAVPCGPIIGHGDRAFFVDEDTPIISSGTGDLA